MARKDPGSDWAKLLWPTMFAAEAGVAMARQIFDVLAPQRPPPPQPEPAQVWNSRNCVVLQLGAARLRRFGSADSHKKWPVPLLVCAPFALHDARIADLCEGHSLIAHLRASGRPVYLAEWLSATRTQAFRRLDDCLSDLNVMVDELGGRCDFVGLCQGGWLSLVHAARFPAKTGKLAIAASPVDTFADDTPFSVLARSTPIETFQELVRLGGGFARGAQAMQFWGLATHSVEQIHDLLQSDLAIDSARFRAQAARFRAWSDRVLDLPGAYYLEVVEKLYKDNQLARGEFVALGKKVNLRDMIRPLFLVAARDDQVTGPAQTLACAGLVGTPARSIRQAVVPGGHFNLFFGARTLNKIWSEVAAWLDGP